MLGAGGVAIENMTAVNYTGNGFFWTGVDGYRGSYLTTSRIGLYGIYAFDSVNGQLDHSYASGSADAGFYIGQCYPCNALIDNVISEFNGIGYSGTNAGGELFIINSQFGTTGPASCPTPAATSSATRSATSSSPATSCTRTTRGTPRRSATRSWRWATGSSWRVASATPSCNNRVWDHGKTGIGLVPYLEDAPVDDQPAEDEWGRPCEETKQDPVNMEPPDINLWNPLNNTVTGNVVSESGVADLTIASVDVDLSTLGNCFAGNDFTTSAPEDLEALAPCDGEGAGDWAAGALDLAPWIAEAQTRPSRRRTTSRRLPELEAQENMPDAATAPADPADDIVIEVDVDAIAVPDAPAE